MQLTMREEKLQCAFYISWEEEEEAYVRRVRDQGGQYDHGAVDSVGNNSGLMHVMMETHWLP